MWYLVKLFWKGVIIVATGIILALFIGFLVHLAHIAPSYPPYP